MGFPEPPTPRNDMTPTRKILASSALAVLFLLASAPAQSLLGTPHVGFSADALTFGDNELDRVLGTTYGVSAHANFALAEALDLKVTGSYLESEGSLEETKVDFKGMTLGANLVYAFAPQGQLTPYVRGGLFYVDTEVVAKQGDIRIATEDSDYGLELGGGVEFLVSEALLLNLDLAYVNQDQDDGIVVEGKLGYWLNAHALAYLSGAYDFDDDNRLASVGILVKL